MPQFDISSFDITSFDISIIILIFSKLSYFILIAFNLNVVYSIYKILQSTPQWIMLCLKVDAICNKLWILIYGKSGSSSSSGNSGNEGTSSCEDDTDPKKKWKRILRYAIYSGLGLGALCLAYYFLKNGGPTSTKSSDSLSSGASDGKSGSGFQEAGFQQLITKSQYSLEYLEKLKAVTQVATEKKNICLIAAMYAHGCISLDFLNSLSDSLSMHKPYAHEVAEFHFLNENTLEELAQAHKLGNLNPKDLGDIIQTAVTIANEDIDGILSMQDLPLHIRQSLAINISLVFYEGLIQSAPFVEAYINRHYAGSPNFPILPWVYKD